MTDTDLVRQQNMYDDSPEILIEITKGTADQFSYIELLLMLEVVANRAVESAIKNMYSHKLTAEDYSWLYSGKVKVRDVSVQRVNLSDDGQPQPEKIY